MVNWSVVLVVLYGIYYTILEPFAGSTWFIILGIPKIALARLFFLQVPYAWAAAIGLHILGWVMQVREAFTACAIRSSVLAPPFPFNTFSDDSWNILLSGPPMQSHRQSL